MNEEESFQQSSPTHKILTGDSDFTVTDTTSIRNVETDSSIDDKSEQEKKNTNNADQSLSNQDKIDSTVNSGNDSEKESKSKAIEKEEKNNSSVSHHSHGSSSSHKNKNVSLKRTSTTLDTSLNSSFDSSSTITTFSTIPTTTTTTNNKSNEQNQSTEEDETVAAAANSLLEKGTLPPSEIQGKVLKHLKSESIQAIFACEYPRAAAIDKAINKVIYETYRRRSNNRELRKEKKVDNKVQKANYMLKKEEEECQNIYRDFLKEEDEKLQKMKERHRKELQVLKEEWDKPETLLPFNKSSPNLLHLRRSQKVLALSKRYEEAEEVKKRADALQRKELKEAKEKATSAYNQARATLIEQHKKELLCFNDHKQRLSIFLDLERQKAVRPFENMAAFYERKQSARALPNGKPAPKAKYSTYSNSYAAKRVTPMFDVIPPTAPEVVAGVSKFKCKLETHSLGLTSIEEKGGGRKTPRRSSSVALNRRKKKDEGDH